MRGEGDGSMFSEGDGMGLRIDEGRRRTWGLSMKEGWEKEGQDGDQRIHEGGGEVWRERAR